MMTRMRNLDDVTAVQLAKSVRKDSSDTADGAAAAAADQQRAQQEETSGLHRLRARDQVRHRWSSSAGRPRSARGRRAAAVPPGSAAPIADANAAASTGRRSLVGRGRYDPMTRRDTYIVTVDRRARRASAPSGSSPCRRSARSSPRVDKDVAEAQQVLDQAKQEKVKFAQAQVAFPRLYASLGRLGKAVPADEDVPSLLVQLNHAAAQANVNFHSVELKLDLAEKAEQDAAAAAPATAAAAGAERRSGRRRRVPRAPRRRLRPAAPRRLGSRRRDRRHRRRPLTRRRRPPLPPAGSSCSRSNTSSRATSSTSRT